jgi:type IV secretory pathway VirB9-like protein
MIAQTVALLLLKPQFPTTLKFDSPIEFVSLGMEGKFFKYLSKDKKVLVVKPLIKSFDVPMVILTSVKSYQFRLKSSTFYGSSLYKVKEAELDRAFYTKHNDSEKKILVGKTTVKIKWKLNKPLNVNFRKINKNLFILPKGSALFINNKRVHY